MTDPIADMLTRIRNAVMARHPSVRVPYSRIKHRIAEILSSEGWVGAVSVEGVAPWQEIVVELKYDPDRKPVLTHVRRLSRPGCRRYVNRDEIPVVLNHFGIAIISTTRGMMTDREARKNGLGGELICEIY